MVTPFFIRTMNKQMVRLVVNALYKGQMTRFDTQKKHKIVLLLSVWFSRTLLGELTAAILQQFPFRSLSDETDQL